MVVLSVTDSRKSSRSKYVVHGIWSMVLLFGVLNYIFISGTLYALKRRVLTPGAAQIIFDSRME